MPDDDRVYIPFPRKLYDDIIRLSDGRLDPIHLAEQEVLSFVVNTISSADTDFWGDRLDEAAEKYVPDVWKRWAQEDEASALEHAMERRPLVWKEVTIRANSDVRMAYGGTHHYATVKHGCIVDDDGEYSPSEWASKVAGGTVRNAWRDVWFREPMSSVWVPAQLLRDQARERMRGPHAKPDIEI